MRVERNNPFLSEIGTMWNDWRAALFAILPAAGMNMELIWYSAALVGAVLIGVVILVWADRWRRSLSQTQAPADELGQYRALLEQGLLSAEEYDRIRRRLEQRPQPKPADATANAIKEANFQVKAVPTQPPNAPPPPNGPPADPGSH
jgi:hypothetical protein